MLARSIQKYYIFVLLFLLAILQSSCQQSENKYRILVVHSYESDYVAYKAVSYTHLTLPTTSRV